MPLDDLAILPPPAPARPDPGPRPSPLVELLEFVRRKQPGIDSVLAVQGDAVVFDCSFAPFRAGDAHQMFSCTKTVLGALIGIAIDDGLIGGVQTRLTEFFPQLADDEDPRKRRITLEHLLTMTSGLAAKDYGGDFAGYFAMLSRADLLQHILSLPLRNDPGAEFKYNNAGSHLLAMILRLVTGETPLAFAQRRLFGPLGITDVAWEAEAQAGNTGWSGLTLRPRDLAKIGQLYRDGGRWAGRQLISSAWVEASGVGRIAAKPHGHYGYHWWVDEDGMMAVGHFGQYLFVRPEQDLVVVITSSLQPNEMLLPKHLMKSYVAPAFAPDAAEAPDPLAQARLRNLVTRAAEPRPEDRFVWADDEAFGVCAEGRFVRTAAPAFSFRYPARASRQDTTSKTQVAALKTFEGFPIFAFFSDIPPGVTLEGAGPYFGEVLKTFGKVEAFDIVSNGPLPPSGGIPRHRTEIRYRFQGSTRITAVVVSAFRDRKWICIEGHTPGDPAEIGRIVESLTFQD